MNNQEIVLKVQAFVDGELPEAEQSEIAALMALDPDVQALVKELKQTRQALASYDQSMELPESREFYWSKILRQIETRVGLEDEPERSPLITRMLRWLLPVTCAGALVVAAAVFLEGRYTREDAVSWQSAYDGVNTLVYRDYEEGTTLFWLSYAGDNAVAKSEEAATIN